jgi:protein-S-isoprenylcysteine O-methyltransferase Ste14
MPAFYLLLAVATVFWLAGIVVLVLAFRWGKPRQPSRFWPAIVTSVAAICMGLVGVLCVELTASQTTNGRTVYRVDSDWFFYPLIVLGVGALALVLWRHRKPPVLG